MITGEEDNVEMVSIQTPFFTRQKHLKVYSKSGGKVVTKQSFKEQCDINVIMASYAKRGLVAQRLGAQYADLPDQMDYHQALNQVMEAQRAFESLPAKLRDRFGNEPGRFLSFIGDETNRAEAEQLGLIAPKKPAEANSAAPVPTPPVEPPKA